MDVDPNLQTDISARRFPGEEEPTSQAAWLSLATVLVFLVAAVLYSLHIAAPDALDEYTEYMKKNPMRGAADRLAAARFCAALGDTLAQRRDEHLRAAFDLEPGLPGLHEELLLRYRERAARTTTAATHIALAEWCRTFNLKQAARHEYQAALRMDKDNPAAKEGLAELGK